MAAIAEAHHDLAAPKTDDRTLTSQVEEEGSRALRALQLQAHEKAISGSENTNEVDSGTQGQYYDDDFGGRAAAVAVALQWAGAAVSSGVLGNIAYDLLKDAIRRIRRQDQHTGSASRLNAREMVDSLAVAAVRARCAELGWAVPSDRSFAVTSCRDVNSGCLIELRGTDDELRATVLVPWEGLPTKGVEVVVVRPHA
jgi:hypothetical protein